MTDLELSYLRIADPEGGRQVLLRIAADRDDDEDHERFVNVGENEYVGLWVTVDLMSFRVFADLPGLFTRLAGEDLKTIEAVCELLESLGAADVTPDSEGWPRG